MIENREVSGVPAAATAQTEIPVGASTLVANSRIDGVPLVTVPGASVDADAGNTGVATGDEPVAPISLENGIPAPQTR